jgi:hypothetical protein
MCSSPENCEIVALLVMANCGTGALPMVEKGPANCGTRALPTVEKGPASCGTRALPIVKKELCQLWRRSPVICGSVVLLILSPQTC